MPIQHIITIDKDDIIAQSKKALDKFNFYRDLRTEK